MTGEELKKTIIDSGYLLVDIANKLGMTAQALNSKLKAKSIRVEFVNKIQEIIGYDNSDNNNGINDSVIISREVFDQISKLTETVLSQQRTIESMQNEKEKIVALVGDRAIFADAK